MLPYEVLVGLRRNMCTCAYGVAGKQVLFKQVYRNVQHLHKFSTSLLENKYILQPFYKTININSTRFYTQTPVSSQYDTKCSNRDNQTPVTSKESLDTVINNIEAKVNVTERKTSTTILSNLRASHDFEIVNNWITSNTEKIPYKDIATMFPEPKHIIHNYYTIVQNEIKIQNSLVSSSKHVHHNKKIAWLSTYTIKWPENKTFSAIGLSKTSSSTSAALKALYWLHLNNRIKNRLPIIYDSNEKKSLLNSSEEFAVDKVVLNNIDNFLNDNENIIKGIISNINDKNFKFYKNDNINVSRQDPISNRGVDINERNQLLLDRLEIKRQKTNIHLPIFNFKNQILDELEKNQVLVIKGDTGCGKTTQVPQFIIDHMTEKGCGGECRMIVTQPRRISAISLAERIAHERNESVGDVVGYQVRLQHVLPKQNGAILFCTTGVLLKKLQTNLQLDGCSHIIIDEAHERTVDTDMLLVLLKRAMHLNKSIKVIIMSATINADLFQEYLNCKALEIPGRLFPVKMNFMEDIIDLGIPSYYRSQNTENSDTPIVDCDQITDLIRWISKNKPPGSILCFLPGWGHIQQIQTNLEEYHDSNQIVLPLHSRIPYVQQNKIFHPPPEGFRKIILATDVAETGITVPDVVYVVDSACHKEARWYEDKGISSINTRWISKANINQRKGRAGRVQKGESYHFITKQQYADLEAYPLPEVLRVSLEKTVLDSKTYSKEKIVDFLGSMPQPPRISSVKKAIYDLQQLGALDAEENLTALGKRIALFTIHPKLSKALVYSSIFQCINPVITISSLLSVDVDIFYGSLQNKRFIREMKKKFHPSSDHLAISWLYLQWLSHYEKGIPSSNYFSRQHRLHAEKMQFLHKIRNLHLEALKDSGMIESVPESLLLDCQDNKNYFVDELVCGVLLSGMDQILKHRNFEIRKGRLSKLGTSLISDDAMKVQISQESVNHKRESWPSSFLTYYQKVHHHDRRTTLIRECSMISPVTLLLFCQGRITGSQHKDKNSQGNKVLLRVIGKEHVNLICEEGTAKTILRFRDLLWSVVRCFIENKIDSEMKLHDKYTYYDILKYRNELMKVLIDLLTSESQKIVNIENEKLSVLSISDDE